MTSSEQTGGAPGRRDLSALIRDLPLWVGLVAIAGPTLYSLGRQTWATEAGAHGPIVLVVGLWLLYREFQAAKPQARTGSLALSLIGLLGSLILYVFGRAFDFISLEVVGLYAAGVAILYSRIGMRALITLWFPVLYLAFLVPAPGWVMDRLTAPLKQFVSWSSVTSLASVGVPVSREGVTIYVAAYRLLVEDACSGMNSLVGLIAVSLLYIYLLRGAHARYAIALAVAAVPIAVLGNIVRIMILILLTYGFGDEVAQGFLHAAAGMSLFVIDLFLVFLLDSLLWRVVPRSWREQ